MTLSEQEQVCGPLFAIAVDLTPFNVVGAAASAAGAPTYGMTPPAVALTGAEVPGAERRQPLPSIRRSNPRARVVVIGQTNERAMVRVFGSSPSALPPWSSC